MGRMSYDISRAVRRRNEPILNVEHRWLPPSYPSRLYVYSSVELKSTTLQGGNARYEYNDVSLN